MPKQPDLSPIRRSVNVAWDPAASFRRLTEDFGTWWPSYACSIGGPRVTRVVFECRAGGRIFEEHADGSRFRWGTVTALEPPRRVAFTYHSSRDPADAQLVEVAFVSDGAGTRVDLVSSGWDSMEEKARRTRSGFVMAWATVLGAFASRFTPQRVLFSAMQAAISISGGRNGFVRNSRGRMPPDETEPAAAERLTD